MKYESGYTVYSVPQTETQGRAYFGSYCCSFPAVEELTLT